MNGPDGVPSGGPARVVFNRPGTVLYTAPGFFMNEGFLTGPSQSKSKKTADKPKESAKGVK